MKDYNPTDIRSQEQTELEENLKRRQAKDSEEADFKWLMGSRRGRRIIWRQLMRAGVFRLSFNTNAMSMAFSEGSRNEGLYIISRINSLCPELYQVMVKENNDKGINDE